MDDKSEFGPFIHEEVPEDITDDKENGKNRGRISRRDCLMLLGTSAATLGTSGVSVASNLSAGGVAWKAEDEIQPSGNGTLPSALQQQLDQLEAHRVYAETPVQERREYAETGKSSDGNACQISLREDWDLVEAANYLPPGQYSESTAWVRVAMPKPVQYAFMQAGKIPNLWHGDNFKRLQWIQKRDWYLRRRFTIPESWSGSTIRLRFDGMDYQGMVWLDGVFLGIQLLAGRPVSVSDTEDSSRSYRRVSL